MSARRALVLLSLFLAITGSRSCYGSGDPTTSVDLEISLMSKYVWRGLVYNEDAVLQPSLTVGGQSGLSFNLWSSFDTTDFCGTKGRCSELDYTLGYQWESGGKEYYLAYAVYTYPNTSFAGTSEVTAGVDLGGPLGANLWMYWDVVEAKSLYINLGWAGTARLGGISVDLSGEFGLADKRHSSYYYGVPSAGLADASACLGIPVDLCGGWSAVGSITYTSVLKQALREAVERPDNFVFGIAVARTL